DGHARPQSGALMKPGSDTPVGGSIDDAARRRFEEAWRKGRPPPIDEFVPDARSPHFLATLEELVVSDLERRWKAGDPTAAGASAGPPPLEAYLERFPQLCQPGVLRRLVSAEYRIRHLFGDRPETAEYHGRFPDVVPAGAELDATLPARPDRPEHEADWPSIDGYDIRGVLGRGGMSRVYKAWQKRLNRLVAIKTPLHGDLANTEELIRFMNEAEAMARLQHPHIIQIFEVNKQHGRPYF